MGLRRTQQIQQADVERVLWWSHFSKLVAPSTTGFLSWGFLKENEYKNNLHTLEELKENIEVCISIVTAEVFL
jgi:hypothetical protein